MQQECQTLCSNDVYNAGLTFKKIYPLAVSMGQGDRAVSSVRHPPNIPCVTHIPPVCCSNLERIQSHTSCSCSRKERGGWGGWTIIKTTNQNNKYNSATDKHYCTFQIETVRIGQHGRV